MTLLEKLKEWRLRTGDVHAGYEDMPGLDEWIHRALPSLDGFVLASNGFEADMEVGGFHYGPCTYQGSTKYDAVLNEDGTVTIYADGEKTNTVISIQWEDLVRRIARRIESSWHPHLRQWNILHWSWDESPTPELIAAWDAKAAASAENEIEQSKLKQHKGWRELHSFLSSSYAHNVNPLPAMRKQHGGTWEWGKEIGPLYASVNGRSICGKEARHPAQPVLFDLGSLGAVYAAANEIQSPWSGWCPLVKPNGKVDQIDPYELK